MNANTIQALPLPNAFDDYGFPFRVAFVHASRMRLRELYGEPGLTDWVDGLGYADYWAFRYDCGLKLCFEFLHDTNEGMIHADLPEIDHVKRHLSIGKSTVHMVALKELAPEIHAIQAMDRSRRHALENLTAVQVWRQGDDGNEMKIGFATSERDARCLVEELESHHHKQTYWTRKVS